MPSANKERGSLTSEREVREEPVADANNIYGAHAIVRMANQTHSLLLKQFQCFGAVPFLFRRHNLVVSEGTSAPAFETEIGELPSFLSDRDICLA